MNYKKHNRLLLLSSSIYAIVVWGLYTLLGFIILGNELFSIRGLLFIGNEFVFTAGEQEFYAEKGLVNKPKRCPECRKKRRMNNRRHRKMYDAVCAKCGAQTQVPFKPSPDKEVYCRECFNKLAENEN